MVVGGGMGKSVEGVFKRDVIHAFVQSCGGCGRLWLLVAVVVGGCGCW